MTTNSITHDNMYEIMSKIAKIELTCVQCKHATKSTGSILCNTCDVLGGPDENFKSRDGIVLLR